MYTNSELSSDLPGDVLKEIFMFTEAGDRELCKLTCTWAAKKIESTVNKFFALTCSECSGLFTSPTSTDSTLCPHCSIQCPEYKGFCVECNYYETIYRRSCKWRCAVCTGGEIRCKKCEYPYRPFNKCNVCPNCTAPSCSTCKSLLHNGYCRKCDLPRYLSELETLMTLKGKVVLRGHTFTSRTEELEAFVKDYVDRL